MKKKNLCDDIDISYIYDSETYETFEITNYNSHGFRGNEFLEDKPLDIFRIITVGGSTTAGVNSDGNTYPSFLQELFLKNGFKNVEIINAGISGLTSSQEIKLIEQKLLDYEPDVLIVYDGWNDMRAHLGESFGIYDWDKFGLNADALINKETSAPNAWKERWTQFCNEYEGQVKTFVVLEPVLGFSDRLLTNYEYSTFLKNNNVITSNLSLYDEYASHLPEIAEKCTNALDFRNVFDTIGETVYLDVGHVNVTGEKIIANNMYENISPYVIGIYSDNILKNTEIYDVNLIENNDINPAYDLRAGFIDGVKLIDQNLNNTIFWFSEIQFVDFSNNDMRFSDFSFVKFFGVKFENNDLSDSKFARSKIINTFFKSNDLSNTDWSGSIIHNTKFEDSLMNNSNMRNTLFVMSEFSLEDTSNLELIETKFFGVKFSKFDFSKIDSKNSAFAGCDLRNTNFIEINDLSVDFSPKKSRLYNNEEIIFPGTNLNGLNFSGRDLSNTIFTIETIIAQENVAEQRKIAVQLHQANLSDTNLSKNNLVFVNFSNSDLSNSDLSFSDLRYANLEGANLEGANLKCINHKKCE